MVRIEGLMPHGKEIAEGEIALFWRLDVNHPRCVVGMERAQTCCGNPDICRNELWLPVDDDGKMGMV